MSRSNLTRRIERLERQPDGEPIRIVWLDDDEESPAARPGEHLIVLRVTDMGL